jgi:acyl-[acyl-carrier-protein]-phospholipid O-acyltransferase/long-chain-fatty-acid--[acyl-carrier-protein] ligase
MDEAFMRQRSVRWFVNLFDTVAIRREQPRDGIRTIIAALRTGDVVCMFPEGQLTRTGTMSKLQRGVEVIAARSNHPLVPLWLDGTWGSIFSFERGQFFGKWPYPVFRNPVIGAIGEPLTPASVSLPILRQALLEASADAINRRFQAAAWQSKLPRGGRDTWQSMSPEDRRRSWVNGYQIGQIHALQRRHPIHVLADEMAALPPAIHAFASLFKSQLTPHPDSSASGGTWVGGDALRAKFEIAPPTAPITYYDFSKRALEPFVSPGVQHCPCLVIDGRVVAMSMPDPVGVPELKDLQRGSKPGTWGKLLPGWFSAPDAAGNLRLHGPAAPIDGLPLPSNCAVDDEGFVR